MRVGRAGAEESRSGPATAGFAECVRRAARKAAAARGQAFAAGPPRLAPRGAADARAAALPGRRERLHEERGHVAGAAPVPAPPEPPVASAELRALVRALPARVDASALGAGASLALAFGRSLAVELRSSAGGVELVLRADRAAGRACAEALPRIVAALRRRGIPVARAEVRPRQGPSVPPR